jgi:glycolate oxidase FAD binding subunit
MDTAAPARTAMVTSTFEDAARSIVGPEHVRAAGLDDVVAGVQPQIVVEPGSAEELAQVLKLANEAALAVIPRGGGTKLTWGNPPRRADVVLSTARLNHIVEHAWADLTVTVEAGCTVQNLQETLAQHGQRLALDAAWPDRATVGGILSTNESGALRLRFGSLRDLIIGVTLALPDGTLASSGGKVVKNVAGYDLPKLATGALGTLGVITRAIFRLHPVPRNSRTMTIVARDVSEVQKLILAIQDSKLAHTAMQARISAETPAEIDVLFEGTEAGLAAQQTQIRKLVAQAGVREGAQDVWMARQELWSVSNLGASGPQGSATAIAKISILPTSLAATIRCVTRTAADAQQLRWRAIIQATGIGWLRLEGKPAALYAALQSLRNELERDGGSLVMQEQPALSASFDAWGDPGDALPLMRAVKQQLDPKGTLNPGRFVGGI